LNGKSNKGTWFGQLLNTPNTKYIIDEDEINKIKINQWFKLLSDNRFSAEERLDRLLLEPNKIKGLNVGFITLMLYLLDKTNYSIWLKVHHKGLNEFIYPKLEKYTGRSTQYLIFNNLSKEFAKKFNFEPTELDWVLWAASLTNP
jgi:thermostable 8-oxoguanine DNA glycosylase